MKKKAIVYFLVGMILLSVSRETGWLRVDYYKSTIQASTTSNWTSNITTIPWNTPAEKLEPCDQLPIAQIPVGISIETDFQIDDPVKSGCQPALASIAELNQPGLWVPVVKSSSFSFSVPVHGGFVRHLDGVVKNGSFSGTFSISGEMTVFGICSHREAERLLKEYLRKEIFTAVRNYTATLK